MPGLFVYSEDPRLAQQLLTPALDLQCALGGPVVAVTTDPALALRLSRLGADRVLVLEAPGATPEALAPAMAELFAREGAEVVLVGGTLRGKHLAAHVAAVLRAGLASDARTLAMAGRRLVAGRMLYGGLAVSDEELDLPAVATIPPSTFPAPALAPAGIPGTVERIVVAADQRMEVLGSTAADGEGVDLAAATRIVAVGRGFGHREDLALARNLAGALRAELACTRAIAEDEHWLPLERYIGISGRTVKPELYLATGLSGQVQHLVGCREAKVIVAVNQDERAPVFEAADYGIVGDLYQVLPLLTAALTH